MAKLNVEDIQNFQTMMHELKEAFRTKREEAKGSRERMKNLAAKSVQAYNEAKKHKALGRPGIDPKMAAKKKKPTVAPAEASGWEEPHIVFPASMTGSKPKVPTVASEQKKTKAAKAEARKRKLKNTIEMRHQPKRERPRRKIGLLPPSPLSSSQFWLLALCPHSKSVA